MRKAVSEIIEALLAPVLSAPRTGRRRLVALVGPPASGKSTLSALLADRMNASGCPTQVVPMDGFHLDNTILSALGLLHRKGAPETFDAGGLVRLVRALPDDNELCFPTFDRGRDLAVAGSGMIPPDCDTVIIEGNYLLLDAPVWRELRRFWDISIRLEVPVPVLRQRLVDRWLAHGLTQEQAETRAVENDLRNAELISTASLPADIVVTS